MKKEYVTLKQAESLKRLGFDGDSLVIEGNAKAYGKNGEDVNWTTKLFHCWKPSLDDACKWLRDNFDMHVTPYASYNKYGTIYLCTIFFIHKDRVYNEMMKDKPLTIDCIPPQIFDTYELAQSAGLDEALKLIFKHKIKIITEAQKKSRAKKIENQKKEHQKFLDKSLENAKNLFKNGSKRKIKRVS